MKLNLKKTLTALGTSAGGLFLSANVVFAQIQNPLQWDNICDAISNILTLIFGLAGAIAVVFLVMGGIQYMTSGGDKIAVEQSRGRITAAVVGLVIVLGAVLVVNTVLRAVATNAAVCRTV
ncbi:MAG: pilin [Patescibacteria group bacterium]